MLILKPEDVAEVKTSQKSLKVKFMRMVLQPHPSKAVEMEIRLVVYHPTRRAWMAHDITTTDADGLRSGRIVVGFYPFTSRKPKAQNVILTLTAEAHGRANVWLDSMLERGLVRDV